MSTESSRRTESTHPDLHELVQSGAADAALLGRGLELDAELLSRIGLEKAQRDPSDDVLAHLYFARGMVNWYLERPTIAAEAFREAAKMRRGIHRARAVVNQMLAMAQAGEKPGMELLKSLRLGGKSLEHRYLLGLAHQAMGEVEEAIGIWRKMLAREEAPAPPPLTEAELMEAAAPPRGSLKDVEARKAAAEALVSALVAQDRVDEAETVWKTHLASEGEAEA